MAPRLGKGKRAASRSPTPDSSSASSPSPLGDGGLTSRKRSKVASVFQASLHPEARGKFKKAGARGTLTAARTESKAGRKTQAGGRSKAPSGSRSAATVGGFHVGTIMWIMQGVISNEDNSDAESEALSPAYRFSPERTLEMQDVVSLKQYQCAVIDYAHGFFFDYSWDLEKIESMLSGLFPRLFAYFEDNPIDPDSAQQSHWLVCTRGKRYSKGLVVFSANEKPTISDLATASGVHKRIGLQEATLVLTTVQPIPPTVVQSWRTSATFVVQDQDTEAGPSTIEPPPSQRSRYGLRSMNLKSAVESEDEVQNVIDLTENHNSDDNPTTPRGDTPPVIVDEVSNRFSSSFQFGGDPNDLNPWYEG